MSKIRNISAVVLARNATANLRRAACKDQKMLWNDVEAAVEAATSQDEKEQAAAPARELCLSCPVLEACEEWARIDKYTGVAAGQVWRNGKVRGQRSRTPVKLAS